MYSVDLPEPFRAGSVVWGDAGTGASLHPQLQGQALLPKGGHGGLGGAGQGRTGQDRAGQGRRLHSQL